MASYNDEEESSSAQNDIETRLRKVKLAVKKATQEALKQTTSTDPRPTTQAAENEDPNASFHLGMELFGQGVDVLEEIVREKLSKIENELQDLTAQCGKNSSRQNSGFSGIARSADEIEEESEQLRTKIAFLRECSSARSLVDESITMSTPALSAKDEPDLLGASKRLVEAQKALSRAQEIIEAEEEKNPQSAALGPAYKIMDSVRSSIRRKKIDLIGKAKSLWHSCVSFSPNMLSVKAPNGLSVAYDVLETFAEDGNMALNETLRKFTRNIHDEIFQPLLDSYKKGKPKTKWSFYESEDSISSTSLASKIGVSSLTKGPVYRLEWNYEDDENNQSSASPETWKSALDFIQRIVTFVADRVMLQRQPLCDFTAMRLLGKPNALPNALSLESLGLESIRLGDDNGLLLQPLLETLEETCMPRYLGKSEIGQLQSRGKEIGSHIDAFIQSLADHNIVSEDGGSRLKAFAESFEKSYVENRRCVLLNEARDLLVNNDYHNTVEVGEDVQKNNEDRALGLDDGLDVFRLHKSSVSDTAFKLMKMCRQTMDEAVHYSTIPHDSPLSVLPATLYRVAREMLDLFRAIIPVTHGHEIATVPRTAGVLHNDGVYLAYHCLTLGLEYKEKFPPAEPADARGNLLRQTCMFVDMVPLFRELADRAMGDMLDLQAKEIVELVGKRITYLGQALGSEEILAEWSDAESALTAGLYHLRHLSHAWKPILASDVLNRSLCFLADVVFTLYLDEVAKASDISSSAAQFVHSLFQKAMSDMGDFITGDKSGSRHWDRFAAIGKFMDMSIIDIQTALSDGVFRSVTGPELSRLITSCFDDSPKRQNLLKLLSE